MIVDQYYPTTLCSFVAMSDEPEGTSEGYRQARDACFADWVDPNYSEMTSREALRYKRGCRSPRVMSRHWAFTWHLKGENIETASNYIFQLYKRSGSIRYIGYMIEEDTKQGKHLQGVLVTTDKVALHKLAGTMTAQITAIESDYDDVIFKHIHLERMRKSFANNFAYITKTIDSNRQLHEHFYYNPFVDSETRVIPN